MHFQRRAPASLRGITLPQPSGTTETSGDATAKQPSGTEGRPKKKENKNVKKKNSVFRRSPLENKGLSAAEALCCCCCYCCCTQLPVLQISNCTTLYFFCLTPQSKATEQKKKILKKNQHSNSASYLPISHATDSALRRVRLQLQLL